MKKILWLSDRDAIIRHADKLAMKLFFESFHYISEKRGLKRAVPEIFLSDPDKLLADGTFKGILRLPDYLSGILADLDLETGKTSVPKAAEGMVHLLSDNEKIMVFHIFHQDGLLRSGRMLTQLKTST